MKSIKEKAEAYDKAIELARKILKTIGNATLGNLVLKNEFENMFPELAESEDERIRKHLIKHFGNKSKEEWNGVPVKDILAWLEKQGDYKVEPKHFSLERLKIEEPILEILDRYLDRVSDEEAIKTKTAINEWFSEYFPKLKEEPVSNNYSALLPCIYNRTLEERVKYCKYCSVACEGRVKEPVSEELEDVSKRYALRQVMASTDTQLTEQAYLSLRLFNGYDLAVAHKDGAKWKVENLWKPADGDDLPEIDREVVVFTQDFPNDAGIMAVAIGHRPNPDGWDGKSIATGKIEHYTPKTYDKGGWNIPDIKYWLDVELPKEIEL